MLTLIVYICAREREKYSNSVYLYVLIVANNFLLIEVKEMLQMNNLDFCVIILNLSSW